MQHQTFTKKRSLTSGDVKLVLGLSLIIALISACGDSGETPQPPPPLPIKAAGLIPPTPPPPEVHQVRSDVPATVPGANRTMENATVNGFQTSKIQCRTEGGLFAGMAILAGLAQHKQTFAACSTKNEEVRVHFAYDGTKTGDVRVAGASSPAVAGCVAKAIASSTFPDPCTCVLAFKVGPQAP